MVFFSYSVLSNTYFNLTLDGRKGSFRDNVSNDKMFFIKR